MAVPEDLFERFSIILPRREEDIARATVKLLLGDRVASAHPNAIGVSSVVNCAPMHVPRHPSVQYYLEVDLADAPALNAEGGVAFEDAATHFERAAAFIKAELDAGRSVLVHCAGGVSRSATITLAYLILEEKMTLREAYMHVSAVRPIIAPNAGFFNQLADLEMKVHGKASVQRALSMHQRVYVMLEDTDDK